MSEHDIVLLEIDDYQSHYRTRLRLCPGLNVLVGESRRGKSAILRALRLLYENEPAGDDFIRSGATKARVKVTLASGISVTRERSKSVNRYIVEEPGKEPQVLEGVGRTVPDRVQEVLGTRTILLGGRPVFLNYANQHEGPFLLLEPGSVKAEAIGRLTGVHVLHEAAMEAARDLQAATREANVAEAELAELDEQLRQYETLPDEEKAAEALQEKVAFIEATTTRRDALLQLQAEWQEHQAKQEGVTRTLTALQDLARWEEMRKAAALQAERLATLTRCREQWAANAAALAETSRVLEATFRLPEAQGRVERARVAAERLRLLKDLKRRWEENQAALTRTAAVLEATRNQRIAAERLAKAAELQERLAKLTRLAERWNQTREALKETADILEATRGTARALALTQQASGLQARVITLRQLAIRWEQNRTQLVRVAEATAKLAGISRAQEKVERAQQAAKRLEHLNGLKGRVQDWQARMRPVRAQLREATEARLKAEAEYRELLLKSNHGLCPTCGQPVTAAIIDRHLHGGE